MFDYPILSEEEAMKARYSLLEDGDYQAVIRKSTPSVSSSGNNMYNLEVDVYDKHGDIHNIPDYLVFTLKMIWKVIHCAESTDTIEQYNKKEFHHSLLIDKPVTVTIRTQKEKLIPQDKLKGKPFGSVYPAKNFIEDYKKPNSNKQEEFKDDSIPF